MQSAIFVCNVANTKEKVVLKFCLDFFTVIRCPAPSHIILFLEDKSILLVSEISSKPLLV